MDQPEKEEGSLTTILHGFVSKLAASAHAVHAISRLIAGAADVPTAWLESKADNIRVNSEAESKVLRALAESAAKEAANDARLVDRSLGRWTRDLIRKQENREAVAIRTIELFEGDPPLPDADQGPSEDFMNVFEGMAERASSESLRDLLARVLVGEIRKPGDFSLRTLHFLSTIDQPLAAAMQRAKSWIVWEMIPFVKPLNINPDYQCIFALQEAGILETGLEHRGVFPASGRYLVPFADLSTGFVLIGPPDAEFAIPVAPLTTIGKQVMGLFLADTDIEFYKKLANGLVEETHAPAIKWGDFQPGRDLKPLKRVVLVTLRSPTPGRLEVVDEIWMSNDSPSVES